MGSIVGIVMEAIHVYLYMRCFRACIGEYRVQKRMVIIFFVVLWGINNLTTVIYTFRYPEVALATAPAQYAVEVPFLLLASLFYQGKMRRRFSIFPPWGYLWKMRRSMLPPAMRRWTAF